MSDYTSEALLSVIPRLGNQAIRARIAKYLRTHQRTLCADLTARILSEVTAFSESRNPKILSQLTAHSSEHVDEIARLLEDNAVSDFDFILTHAKNRAMQHFPLEATLHSYRCGHKMLILWLRTALMETAGKSNASVEKIAAADFALEYTDAVSTLFTTAYLAQSQLSRLEFNRRSELLPILLNGYDESDRRVTDILRQTGYLKGRQSYCVAVICSVEQAEMLNPERARRMLKAVNQLLHRHAITRLIDICDNKVVAVVSDIQRLSGWSAPKRLLNERLSLALSNIGVVAVAGISKDIQATESIPEAYKQAQLALQLANVSRCIVRISDLSLRDVLLHSGNTEIKRALPDWTDPFIAANKKANGVLVDTLRAYAAANMNILKAAARLTAHPNTVYFRLKKIADITGQDARSYHRLGELLLAVDYVTKNRKGA